jgi:hypothetical protein
MAQNSGSQFGPNPYTSLNLEATLASSLHVFLHLADQAPVETVCRSALYLLEHAPATKQAVFDYLGTLYKLFTVLYLQCQQSLRTATSADQIPDTTDINRAVDLIETSLAATVERSIDGHFATELTTWLVDLLGSLVSETGVKFAESNAGVLTPLESYAFRNPGILDGLEIWSNQCKTTQSLLTLIKKCFVKVAETRRDVFYASSTSELLDTVLVASQKYASRFDWLLCYLSGLGQELLFEKLLAFNFKETCEPGFQGETPSTPRINVINFYAQNYSGIVRDTTVKFLAGLENDAVVFSKAVGFLLRTASQSPSLLVILADEVLLAQTSCESNKLTGYLTSQLLLNEKAVSSELFGSIKSLSNSTCVYDLLASVLDWLQTQSYDGNSSADFSKFKNIIVSFFLLREVESREHLRQRTFQDFLGSCRLYGTDIDRMVIVRQPFFFLVSDLISTTVKL